MWVLSLGQEEPPENEMATCPSILAWEIPWAEVAGGLQSWGCKESNMTEHKNTRKKQLQSNGKITSFVILNRCHSYLYIMYTYVCVFFQSKIIYNFHPN